MKTFGKVKGAIYNYAISWTLMIILLYSLHVVYVDGERIISRLNN